MGDAIEDGLDVGHVERLFQPATGIAIQEVAGAVRERTTGDEHEAVQELGPVIGDSLIDLHAAEDRHHEITQDQVEGRVALEVLERLGPRVEDDNVTLVLERKLQGLAEQWFIIDY